MQENRFSARRCPACGHQQHTPLFELPAHVFCEINSTYRRNYAELLGIDREMNFPVVTCASCAFVFAARLPDADFLNKVYDEVIDPDIGFRESTSPGWVSHLLDMGSILLEQLARRRSSQPSRVLDFGCGYGSLVQAVNGPAVNAFGFETSPRRVEYLRKLGIAVLDSMDLVRKEAPFDAIVLSDVLEHVPDPADTLRMLHQLLRADGILLINVPNFNADMIAGVSGALQRKQAPSREVNPWEHLNYFSPASLRSMLRAQGYAIVELRDRTSFGLRTDVQGWDYRRAGNVVKSLLRFVRASAGAPVQTTTVVAQRVQPAQADSAS